MALSPRQASPRIYSPPWDTLRSFLTGDFLLDPAPIAPPPLSSYPPDTQQKLATFDALSALLGLRPNYATVGSENSPVYTIAQDRLQRTHPHITPFLSRILPLATHHAKVKFFIEQSRLAHTSGHVRQAISSALTDLLADYNSFILRLESEAHSDNLSLQKLHFYVQPTARSMALLNAVADSCAPRRGGAALDALYSLAVSFVGSPDEKTVLAFMVGRAAEPVLDIMAVWLSSGVIDDPYDEFFISHDTSYMGTALDHKTWEMRFTVNPTNVPSFLGPFVESVLRAGKYLSVLRDCSVDVRVALEDAQKTLAEDEHLASHENSDAYRPDRLRLSGATLLSSDASRRIGQAVDRAFRLSSAALMTHLKETVRLRERLRSLKCFFLLEQGDYLVHFLDAADAELSKPISSASRSKLASLLELSVRSGVSASDAFLDDLSCELLDKDLSSQIASLSLATEASNDQDRLASHRETCGYEAFGLTYRLKWPMKLIISITDMMKYQLMFRYIFYCKHVERELEQCWRVHARAKGPLRRMPTSFIRSFSLRNRMLQFVRNMLYYTVADVLEPNWRTLDAELRNAKTIDDIMLHHSTFLGMSSLQSLISHERHQAVFKNVCETCLAFAAYTHRFEDLFASREGKDLIEEQLVEQNYPALLAKFETSFDMHFANLLDGVAALSKTRANVHLANLWDRLDAGGYYTRFKERSLASLGAMAL